MDLTVILRCPANSFHCEISASVMQTKKHQMEVIYWKKAFGGNHKAKAYLA